MATELMLANGVSTVRLATEGSVDSRPGFKQMEVSLSTTQL